MPVRERLDRGQTAGCSSAPDPEARAVSWRECDGPCLVAASDGCRQPAMKDMMVAGSRLA